MAESRLSALRGMTFEIRRTPPEEKLRRKQEKVEEAKRAAEKEYVLNLVPFGNVPHIPFDNVKYGESAVRTLVVVNRTSKPVHVTLEKLPKPEKGFEMDYIDFEMNAKEEAQLKIGWVPQGGTPLRETVYVKFGKLKTQMLLIGTCKVPPSMIEKRKPLRPSSVQNLKRQSLNSTASAASKKDLPPNPVIRQPQGTCPPVRPYVSESNVDEKTATKKVFQEENLSWSPQPFKMAEVKRETFSVPTVEAFEMKENVASPRRETFIVPNADQLRRDTYLCPPKPSSHINNDTFRRETFIPSNIPPMVTSTPRIGGSPQLDFVTPGHEDRRGTYVLPSTVKKPLSVPSPGVKSSKSPIVEEAKRALQEVADLEEDRLDLTLKEGVRLSAIKEEASSNVPTDIDQLLEISGVDLELSPQKKGPAELSGINIITEQTLSLPPRSTSDLTLQLSNGDHVSTNISSETYIKDDVANLEDFDRKPLKIVVDSPVDDGGKTVISTVLQDSTSTVDFESLSPMIHRTPVKTLSFEDDNNPNLSNVSTATYVKSPMLCRIVEEEDNQDYVEADLASNSKEETLEKDDGQLSKSLAKTSAYKLLRNSMLRQMYEKNHAAVIIQGTFRRFMIERRAMKWEATITIQSYFRMWIQRKKYQITVAEREQSAVAIQKYWRAFLAKKQYQKSYQSIVLIQSLIRRHQARQQLSRKKDQHKAVIAIQAAFRGYVQRKWYRNSYKKIVTLQSMVRMWIQKKKYQSLLTKREESAITIQAYWRGFVALKKYQKDYQSIVFIQSLIRRYQAQQQLSQMKVQHKAAIKIQYFFKVVKAKILLQHLKQQKIEEHQLQKEAATKIQAAFRGYVQRQHFMKTRNIIITLQSMVRMWIQKNKYQVILAEREEKALIIQKYWRGFTSRRKYQKDYQSIVLVQSLIRRHQAKNQLSQLKVEYKAAITIQALFRGFVQRKCYKKCYKKIVIIQSIVRMWIQKRKYQSILSEREKSAVTIQKYWRGFLAKEKYTKDYQSVVLIQSLIRRHQAQQKLSQLKLEQKAAIKIQAVFRGFIQKQHYKKSYKHIVTLQSMVRMGIQKRKYQSILIKREESAVTIQKCWRGFLAKEKYMKDYQSVVLIQSLIRRHQAQQKLSQLKVEQKAAIKIQAIFRGFVQRKQYKMNYKHIVTIQSMVRMGIQRRKYQSILIKREKSAVTIQKCWRGFLAKEKYTKDYKSVILIQSLIRRYQAEQQLAQMKVQHKAAIKIQCFFKMTKAKIHLRALKDLKIEEAKNEQQLRNAAATTIQAAFRCYVQRNRYNESYKKILILQSMARMWIQKKKYQSLLTKREESAITIQKYWKGFVTMKNYRKDFQSVVFIQSLIRRHQAQQRLSQMKVQHKAAIKIQSFFKMTKARSLLFELKQLKIEESKHHQKIKNEAALLIQSTFRGYKQRKEYQGLYGKIVLLQSMTRMILAQKKVNSIKQLKAEIENRQRQHAAIVIQRCFRSYKVCRDRQRNQAALVIQAAVHHWMARLKLAREEKRREASALLLQRVLQGWTVRRDFLAQKRAATLIKAAWKGYKLRMALKNEAIAKQLAEVQRRVSEAHRNATEDQKLCNRTAFALDYLYTYKDMAMLIESLNNLNVTLRYSTNCCLRMFEAEAKALSILMDILNGLNRSVPHIEVMSIILDILISLAEYEETRSKLAGIGLVFPSVVAAMGKGEKNAQVFGKGCSLLWRLASTKKGQSHLKDERIFKKLKEFDDTQNRLKRRTQSASQLTRLPMSKIVKKVSLTTKHGCQLTESIVRYHTDPHAAINGLMKRLSKCT